MFNFLNFIIMIYQETEFKISENDFLEIIVKLEMYQQERKKNRQIEMVYDKELQGLHDKLQKIWNEMPTGAEYTLFENIMR